MFILENTSSFVFTSNSSIYKSADCLLLALKPLVFLLCLFCDFFHCAWSWSLFFYLLFCSGGYIFYCAPYRENIEKMNREGYIYHHP